MERLLAARDLVDAEPATQARESSGDGADTGGPTPGESSETAPPAAADDESGRRSPARLHAVVADLGQRALGGAALSALMDEATKVVADTLEVEFSSLLEMLPDRSRLLLRSGVGWEAGRVGHTTVNAGTESEAGYALSTDSALVVPETADEKRFRFSSLLRDHQVRSTAVVIVRGRESPFGVLGAHCKEQRSFAPEEVHFLQSVANVIAHAIDRERADQKTAVLVDLTRTISGTFDLDQLVDRVEQRVTAALDSDVALTLYWSSGESVFQVISQHGAPAELDSEVRALRFGADTRFAAWLARGQPAVINDPTAEPAEIAGMFARFQIGALIAAPLRIRDRELGAIVVIRLDQRAPIRYRRSRAVRRHCAATGPGHRGHRALPDPGRGGGGLLRAWRASARR